MANRNVGTLHTRQTKTTLRKYTVITSDNVKLYSDYYSNGKDREVVLCVHGVTGNSKNWTCFRKMLDEFGFDSIAFDLRGHGLSDKYEDLDYKIPRMSLDAVEVYESFHLNRPAILCGVSLGGAVVLGWTTGLVRNALPISALIVVSSSPRFFNLVSLTPIRPNIGLSRGAIQAIKDNDLKEFGRIADTDVCEQMENSILKRDLENNDVLQKRGKREEMSNATRKALEQILKGSIKYNVTKELPNILVPTLIVHGGTDSLFPFSSAIYMYQKIPNAQLAGIPNRGHYVMVTDMVMFHGAVKNFLGNVCTACVDSKLERN